MKSVIVTGGTVRLGAAIAEKLRKRGWRVITTSHRADSGADRIVDFTDANFSLDLEGVDAIVNNAALFRGEVADVLNVNLVAPLKIVNAMAEKGGAVVNILDSSILNRDGALMDDKALMFFADEANLHYLNSKSMFAREAMKVAREEGTKARINFVAPGPVMAPEGVHEKAATTPFGRPSAQAVAEAVAFLLEAESVTGVIVPVDGGAHLGNPGRDTDE